jgi:putative glutamine amidotransferase
MQLINYKFGGCLVPVDAHKHVNRQHKLKVFKNNILKQREFVNSYHNYSIDFDSLSDDLDVLAISSDGEVEAFMHKKYSIFGMMWHPERNKPFCEADKELVMKLINGTY